ncbi:hypothetical protein A3D81_00600 [Candidatus Curtissbacteria bacterium RIFCSPHIGHO2_02_FULL_40_17]|uniref:Glycosyltransferase 2-like domain-containing protein n=4 Tax=Candidatus Curtissiibacteriota TaxID=1752717 RepID=A0A1F5GIE7_9BACT|nr:MAG: hypothetical protein A2693_01790 [Candidatus Curtissbacteria bacterium RIFCSPHIGHO2_01_FULL_40_12]OGD91595.1 MAG: hypothetical protein A3D81_00600 [Candidatus Curtissbacteria bacterium RIFCSPHIGHO2_02_FULL_40_17]OGE03438.1 MAG: hypothetical protein A3F45_04370 [Candidatus Curtissbacteria bacterium RIFCSPHIGHO2_12_FULL_41_17]OGE07899.1 MAG: hypothetical protein A3I53_04445 [Candidatus Curtissbacteria bacterium RIFCSPLOWO2_02_FULL_40_13b]
MVDKYPNISVIIPCLNGKKVIGNLIKSIEKQKYSGKIEIIVTDDGSTDGTSNFIKSHYKSVKLITFGKNRGSAPALNAAAKLARFEFLLATNDDVIFDKKAFFELINCAKSQQNVGITTGKMLDTSGRFAIPGFRINHYLGYHPYDLKDKNKIRECHWAAGACIFIRKNLLLKLGNFDPDYIFCGEDYDISFRVKKAGYKILYTPDAVFTHNFRRSGQKIQNYTDLFAHYRGKTRYIFKNCTSLQILSFLFIQYIIVGVWYLLNIRLKTIAAMYQGFAWNILKLPLTLSSRVRTEKITQRLKL